MIKLFFYPLGCCALISSLFVVMLKNPIKSVLSLILTFFLTAMLWLLLKAEFLAILLVIIYVGAVLVLFLFAIMLLDFDLLYTKSKYIKFWLLFVFLFFVLFFSILYLISLSVGNNEILTEKAVSKFVFVSDVKLLGNLLYSTFLIEFELAGFLLLVGIIVAITLIFTGEKRRKTQSMSEQSGVKKGQRIFFIPEK